MISSFKNKLFFSKAFLLKENKHSLGSNVKFKSLEIKKETDVLALCVYAYNPLDWEINNIQTSLTLTCLDLEWQVPKPEEDSVRREQRTAAQLTGCIAPVPSPSAGISWCAATTEKLL